MSFQNFDSFQNQHPSADAAAAAPGAPATADTTMTGQADPTAGSFQGPAPGEPSAAPVAQQGNEGKTTLWYAWPHIIALMHIFGKTRSFLLTTIQDGRA